VQSNNTNQWMQITRDGNAFFLSRKFPPILRAIAISTWQGLNLSAKEVDMTGLK